MRSKRKETPLKLPAQNVIFTALKIDLLCCVLCCVMLCKHLGYSVCRILVTARATVRAGVNITHTQVTCFVIMSDKCRIKIKVSSNGSDLV